MRIRKRCLILLLGAGIILTAIPNLYADETSEAILKLLIKKGIITQREVDEIRAQVSKEAPEGLEDRVTKLEEEVEKSPRIGKFLDGADMNISGYIQTRYTNNEDSTTNSSFSTKNSKLTLKGHMTPEVSYKLEIGPHKSPSSSILYDAYATASYIPYADITMGQFKVPFSEEYLTSSSSLKTADRALFQGNLTNEYGLGARIDKHLFDKKLYYAFAVINGPDRSTSENNNSKDVLGRLVWSPFKDGTNELLDGLKIGAAVQHGRQPLSGTTVGDRDRYLGLVKYAYKGLTLQSEYVHQDYERTTIDENLTTNYGDLRSYGWYLLTAYKFPFIELAGNETNLEPIFKFEQYDPDAGVGKDRQDMYTLGLTWYLNKYFYLMGNYQFREEQNDTSNNRFILQSQIKF